MTRKGVAITKEQQYDALSNIYNEMSRINYSSAPCWWHSEKYKDVIPFDNWVEFYNGIGKLIKIIEESNE